MVNVRRLAAEILGVGESRIRISPDALDKVADVTTRGDVRRLIDEGSIWVEPAKGNSRGRWRELHRKRRRGRRRGHGSRKGGKQGRGAAGKEVWVDRIRALRKYLYYMKSKGLIDAATWRTLYRMAKGGYFRSVEHLKMYVRDRKLLKET